MCSATGITSCFFDSNEFSVAHDEKQPFIVVSSDIYTKVYGTEFNVRSYGDEEVHVTLVQGRVSVKKTEGGSEYTLNPGENARFVESVPEITKVNVNRYIAWKDAILVKKHKQNTNCIKNIFTILLLTFLSMERFLLKSIAINDRFGY